MNQHALRRVSAGCATYLAAGAMAVLLGTVGCNDGPGDASQTTAAGAREDDSGRGGAGAMSSSDEIGDMVAGGSQAATGRIRVAHLSPDAPAVDFCVDPGSGFIGPVLAGLGDTDGLAYTEVTDYLALPAATHTVRLVAPSSSDCDTPLGPPDTTGVVLTEGVDATLAAVGMLTPSGSGQPFELAVYEDENADPASGKAHLRFIHASPDTPGVDVGIGSEAGSDFAAIWDNVSYPEIGRVSGGDYLETDPLNDMNLSARVDDSANDGLVITGVDLPAGVIATAFVIGNLDAEPEGLMVLLCVDNGTPASCSVVP
ncbi:MAG: DUF4397 domain-containing protein [Deltaproteobacteria bacterium]|jgi:hypothetical protein|nr:DUF4397 domain-containing protein [Deltaproteobacteria bacterium]MBW2535541.1 DUF4397 domain-containing protein [Deltaproteobacteria bacterium]